VGVNPPLIAIAIKLERFCGRAERAHKNILVLTPVVTAINVFAEGLIESLQIRFWVRVKSLSENLSDKVGSSHPTRNTCI